MIDAGIRDGGVVTARCQSAADPGDIVVALLAGGEATVKKLRIADDGAWLMPCNLAYSPIHLDIGNDLGRGRRRAADSGGTVRHPSEAGRPQPSRPPLRVRSCRELALGPDTSPAEPGNPQTLRLASVRRHVRPP
ncbi:S24 family peptidase [Streptomyces sp. NPDC046215]